MDSILSPQILVAIVALDHSNSCYPLCHVCYPACPLAGCAHSVELFRFRSERRVSAASGHRDGNAVFSRVYVWLFTGRTPGRKRAANAQDHRHDAVAQQCRSLHGWSVHIHVSIHPRRPKSPRGQGVPVAPDYCGRSLLVVFCRLSLPDRLCRAFIASNFDPDASWERGARGH